METKILLVGRFRVTASVTVTAHATKPTVGQIGYTVESVEACSGPEARGFDELTSVERADFYDQVTAFACTQSHGFADLRRPSDPVLLPTKF